MIALAKTPFIISLQVRLLKEIKIDKVIGLKYTIIIKFYSNKIDYMNFL